jgi:flagellar biosynthesis component FlhA
LPGAAIIASVAAILWVIRGKAFARAAIGATAIAILGNVVLAAITSDTVNRQAYVVLTVLVACLCAVILSIACAIVWHRAGKTNGGG